MQGKNLLQDALDDEFIPSDDDLLSPIQCAERLEPVLLLHVCSMSCKGNHQGDIGFRVERRKTCACIGFSAGAWYDRIDAVNDCHSATTK